MSQRDCRIKECGFLSVKEFADYAGIHAMTAYRIVKQKSLPFIKIGGCWKINKKVLDIWIEKRSILEESLPKSIG